MYLFEWRERPPTPASDRKLNEASPQCTIAIRSTSGVPLQNQFKRAGPRRILYSVKRPRTARIKGSYNRTAQDRVEKFTRFAVSMAKYLSEFPSFTTEVVKQSEKTII